MKVLQECKYVSITSGNARKLGFIFCANELKLNIIYLPRSVKFINTRLRFLKDVYASTLRRLFL